ncbi:hypothetical protein R5R35_001827 [Gryllus longicercus]|uniref:Uncharacterized protein n=1 Tax=Gryllus longicercus TaxID=2509291 RepID=A0AAN9W0Z1_9ORTH
MRAHSVLLLTTLAVALLTEVNGKKGRPLGIYKCCGMFQMLSGDGQSCVDAAWPRGHRPRLHRFFPSEKTGVVLRRSDAAWVARWLPPGLPLDRVWAVFLDGRTRFYYKPVVQTVREAVLRDEEQEMAGGAAYWRGDRAYFSQTYEGVSRTIKNPWPPIKQRKAVHSSWYCVDAARPPLAPFALLSDVNCAYEDCFIKCCHPGEVMAAKAGGWMCEDNPRGYWTPHNSSFASFVPADVPFKRGRMSAQCLPPGNPSPRLRPVSRGDAWEAYLLRHRFHDFFFASWETCVDAQLRADGTLGESIFYCEESQITRGVYRLLRPISIVSSALTMVAVISVACNRSMRLKAHGWCLACHAVCLFGFNLGQVVYYLSISDAVDTFSSGPPYYLINTCVNFALLMYFLLTAANCWLTALCVNMALGFGKLQVARSGGGQDWKRFLVLSALAWGVPTVMTGLCAHAYEWDRSSLEWFTPTLVETRTCFDEVYLNGLSFSKVY